MVEFQVSRLFFPGLISAFVFCLGAGGGGGRVGLTQGRMPGRGEECMISGEGLPGKDVSYF